MGALGSRGGAVAATMALAALLLASQAVATASAPAGGRAATGRVLGRAGFAYLGGLRTFGAAVLWNRIEPQFHTYYGGVPLDEQKYMAPTLRMIVALDPQFIDAYYIGSYIVSRQIGEDAGLLLARDGVENNPTSGLLHANLAQMLFVQDKRANRGEILRQIELGLGQESSWRDARQEYEELALMSEALKSLGRPEEAAAARHRLDDLHKSGLPVGDHDHDHDGKQDH